MLGNECDIECAFCAVISRWSSKPLWESDQAHDQSPNPPNPTYDLCSEFEEQHALEAGDGPLASRLSSELDTIFRATTIESDPPEPWDRCSANDVVIGLIFTVLLVVGPVLVIVCSQ